MEEGSTGCQFDVRGGRYETLGFIIKKGVEYTLFQFSKFSCSCYQPPWPQPPWLFSSSPPTRN